MIGTKYEQSQKWDIAALGRATLDRTPRHGMSEVLDTLKRDGIGWYFIQKVATVKYLPMLDAHKSTKRVGRKTIRQFSDRDIEIIRRLYLATRVDIKHLGAVIDERLR